MATNFTFLKQEFPQIYDEIAEAELHTFTAPRYAALLAEAPWRKHFFGSIKMMTI